MLTKFALIAVAGVSVSACVGSPCEYETTPVEISTPKGSVTCQLYSRDQVLWDMSIARPSSMGTKEADNYCIAEGKRRKKG